MKRTRSYFTRILLFRNKGADISQVHYPVMEDCLSILCIYMLLLFCTDDDSGLHRSQLINWYLEEIASDIDSEQELLERKAVVEKVIYRLVHHVCRH